MRLHKASLIIGVVLALVVFGAMTLLAAPSSAFTWPWNRSKPATTVTVSGSLSCSDVLSLDGYGGSARALTLKAGSRSETLTFPFKLRSGSIFKPPTYQKYRFRVDIPQGKDSVELNWSLSCWGAGR